MFQSVKQFSEMAQAEVSMQTKLLAVFLFGYGFLLSTPLGIAATQFDSVTVGYSSFSADYVPLWAAVEEHLGRKYGLELNAVYAGRVRPQQLLASGETPLCLRRAPERLRRTFSASRIR
jgi:hypothetical protein